MKLLSCCIAALLVIELLTGCETMRAREAEDRFEQALRVYGAALRWGHYNIATGYLRARDGTPLETPGEFDPNVRVVAYDVKRMTILKEGEETIVDAEIGYFYTNNGTVRTIKDQQHWWYDVEGRHWFLDGRIPAVFLSPGGGPGV